ncbi:MAC/perforin domain-containing protein [Chitinophaga rhizophila]|uniref:MACPF domain-containing protein n=1 Tax=Chitinophaga rhizophila TaxID=2866212 RepID=A0ABS7G6K5_9BACT|nr:MAC/perforin domain-containing protein [Chitinophaga rhizophila]MBW8683283.1 hypothetical protein [Chitinophaga rhizophila]
MKRVLLLSFAAFCFSCQKESKQDIPVPDEVRKPTTEAAGDGAYDVIGYGCDVTGPFADAASSRHAVVDLAAFQAAFPNRVLVTNPNRQSFFAESGADASSMLKKVSLSLSATATYTAFTGTLKGNFTSNNFISSKEVYGIYNLLMERKQIQLNTDAATLKNYLTAEFRYDLANLPVHSLVERYGTHVHVNIITGGKLQIIYKAATKSARRATAAAGGLEAGIGKVFAIKFDAGVDKTAADSNYAESVTYHAVGGGVHVPLVTVNVAGSTFNPNDWQRSVNDQNIVLVAIPKQGLIAITDLVDDPAKKAELASYIEQYILNNAINLQYGEVPLYRYMFYNGSLIDNLLTTTPTEVAGLTNWTNTGIIGKMFTDNSMPGTIPIYRYFQNNRTHFYTNNFNEIGNGGNHGKFEWIEGYIYAKATAGAIPIYRYNSNGMHWYTTQNAGQSFYYGAGILRKQFIFESILGYIPQ